MKAVRNFNGKRWHFDGYIDAGKHEVGEVLSLSDLEKEFSKALKKEVEFERNKAKQSVEEQRRYKRRVERALDEAHRTGKDVIIRVIGGYNGDAVEGREDVEGWVEVCEVATPDGRIVVKEYPSY